MTRDRLYFVAETEAGVGLAVVTIDGALVAYATRRVATDFAQLLNALDPSVDQLAVLLGDGAGRALLRRWKLRHASPCLRCGAVLVRGERAWWSPNTSLVRHVGRCGREGARA